MSMHLISLKYVNNIQNKIKKGRVIVGIRKRERDRERERISYYCFISKCPKYPVLGQDKARS